MPDEPRRTVHVEFVDAGTGASFAEADLPVESLPESFAAATTLHLGDEPWSVVRADPPTAAEFGASGRLRLTLRKERTADPADILFSLPTLENVLPPVEYGAAAGGRFLELHEDDWRQVEFVALRWQEQIDACLDAIRRVYAEERAGIGFRNLHVRTEIPAPLDGAAVTLDELRALLDPALTYDGIRFADGGIVRGGFAFGVPVGTVYGYEDDGRRVAALCLHGTEDAPEALRTYAAANGLCLIDWCGARQTVFDRGE